LALPRPSSWLKGGLFLREGREGEREGREGERKGGEWRKGGTGRGRG